MIRVNQYLVCAAFFTTLLGANNDSHANALNGTPNPDVVAKALSESRASAGLARKESIGEAKIGRFLRPALIRSKTSDPQKSSPFIQFKGNDRVQVYVTLTSSAEDSSELLSKYGIETEVVDDELNKVQGWVDVALIEALAEENGIKKITVPSYARPYAGNVTTQGDAILRANELRRLGITGKGVKVGIISDGANNWRTPAASGDLPAQITTFGSCSTRVADPRNCRSRLTCNEGTAMAEIVHDIAPDAELAVAAVSTSLEFIQQARRLATTFEADIIVDDLGFFGEPYFEDGDIARAISGLPSNVLYFSSAGNSGNTHYERDYSTLGSTRHNFGVEDGVRDEEIGFEIGANRGAFVLMQWSDRYESPNSNYDLFVFDQSSEIGRSTGFNSPAIEGVCVYNGGTESAVRFAVVDKLSGSNRRLEMFFLGARAIEYPSSTGSVFGHAGTPRALAVAAINAGSSTVAFYSSRGPARIDYPSLQLRAKPDLAATDGVSVTGAGGFSNPFFGTSAAAPHAAAVAAQLLSAGPDVTPQEVRSALLASASGGGGSTSVGRGRINALAAFERLGIELDPDGMVPQPDEDEPNVVPPIMLLLGDDDS